VTPRRRKRIDPALFRLPSDQLRGGEFSDRFASLARELLPSSKVQRRIMLQVSAQQHGWLSGIDEAIAILRAGVEDWSSIAVHALYEGDAMEPWDTVLTVEGEYAAVAPYETPILGVLAHRTRVCTNVREIVEAARPKPVLFFGARHDHWQMQTGDGFAAMVAGARQGSTTAHGTLWGGGGAWKPMGSIPPSLIAAFGGDTAAAAKQLARHHKDDVPFLVPVDYENDCVRTSLEVARALGERLWGVRLDTAETMVDRSVIPQLGTFQPTGVNPQLVWNVRNALDAEGFGDVHIVVSGGFDADRVAEFEEDGVPVDAYGVGSAAYRGTFGFAADVVMLDGKPQARAGRGLRENPQLERVK
jgi:nicotinate phosphoribosyltransferase